MLRQRVIVVLFLLPIGLAAIFLGGLYFTGLVGALLLAAGWEYASLFKKGGYHPSSILVVVGIAAFLAARYYYGLAGDPFRADPAILAGLILLAMVVHVFGYERGHPQSGTDFVITVGGFLYLGFIGSYLLALRGLPQGEWWLLTALPAVWLADSAAYFIGKRFGKRRFSPRLSPKKTWEGYFAGVLLGPPLLVPFIYLWQYLAKTPLAVTPLRAVLIAVILAVLTPLGDLGESMFKRQVEVKDSSHLFPGHGGALDRVDSWLWAGVLGYYLITWLY